MKHEGTAWRWQNGRKEVGHSHALHGDELGEECMRHDVKRKAKHRSALHEVKGRHRPGVKAA